MVVCLVRACGEKSGGGSILLVVCKYNYFAFLICPVID